METNNINIEINKNDLISTSNAIDKNSIIFNIKNEEIIKINETGFYWKGELITEGKEIYEKFKLFFQLLYSGKPINVIDNLKESLKFYADENNYHDIRNPNSLSGIELDSGNHARFALEQADKIEKMMNEAEDDYLKKISVDIAKEVDSETILNLIEKYKHDNNI